jgi:hypothetical protein
MVTVKPLYHSKVSHELMTTAARETMAIIEPFGAEDPLIVRQHAVLGALTSEMDGAFQRILINKFTAIRAKIDTRRDKIIIAIRAAINSAIAQGVISPAKAEAALKIQSHLDNMSDNVTSLGYREESAQIRALLSAVLSLIEEQKVSGTTALFAALESTQNDFEEKSDEKNELGATSETPRTIKDIKKDIVFRLDALFGHLSLNSLDMPEKYGATVTNINKVIDEVMSKAKADDTREESLKEASLDLN